MANVIKEPPRILIGDDEQASLMSCVKELNSGAKNNNQLVSDFEAQFAEHLNVKHVIATNSATSALQVALQAAGIKKGQEVIVTPYTFSATAHAIINAGGVPVFADIDEETLCLDLEDVRSKISEKTFAIMAVHIGGKAENMGALCELAEVNNILVFEDAAQAHGAKWEDRYVGTFGRVGVFSFGTKLVSCFRGGAIVTDDDRMAQLCRSYIYHGVSNNKNSPFTHDWAGYNFQLTGVQAALLMPQIKKLPQRFERRYQNGLYLKKRIEEIDGLKVASPSVGGTSNFYMFEILYNDNYFSGTRESLISALIESGLPVLDANIIDKPIYENPSLKPYLREPCKKAEQVYRRLIVLGHFLRSTLLEADRNVLDEVVDRFASVGTALRK